MKLEIESDALSAICPRVKPQAISGTVLYRDADLEKLDVITDFCYSNPAGISATVISNRSYREGVATHIAVEIPV